MAGAEALRNNTASECYVKRFKEKEVEFKRVEEQFTFPCANGSIKFAGDGPSYHTTNQSRSHSSLVEDVIRCLLREEEDGSDLAKEEGS